MFRPAEKGVMEAIAAMVADQDALAERIAQMVVDRKALPREGEFPMEFTDMHDLDVDYLIGAAAEYQKQDIATLGPLIESLRFAPAAKSLAEETLGMAKGHLDSLGELIEPSSESAAKQ